MSGRLSGKKAMITGGASGLGACMGKMFAAEGAQVVLADINEEGAQEVAAGIQGEGGKSWAIGLDVTDEEGWKEATAKAADLMGGMSILVNSAGIGGGSDIEETTFKEWRKVVEVDMDSVFLGCKYAMKYLKEGAPSSIVNLSSIAGLIAAHNMTAYNAAKAGVWLMSKSVALHCARKGYDVRCNSIHPTFVDTPILDYGRERYGEDVFIAKLKRQVPLGRIGVPEDVGWAAVYLASDESRFVTGAEIKVDGGISAM